MTQHDDRVDLERLDAVLDEGVLVACIGGDDTRSIDEETRHARAEVAR